MPYIKQCKHHYCGKNPGQKKSITYLREKGLAKAAKRAGKETGEGKIISYIHGNGKTGVILELNCETDFVANNADFEAIGKEIALQITAMSPLCRVFLAFCLMTYAHDL